MDSCSQALDEGSILLERRVEGGGNIVQVLEGSVEALVEGWLRLTV